MFLSCKRLWDKKGFFIINELKIENWKKLNIAWKRIYAQKTHFAHNDKNVRLPATHLTIININDTKGNEIIANRNIPFAKVIFNLTTFV